MNVELINQKILESIRLQNNFIPKKLCPDQKVCELITDSNTEISSVNFKIWKRTNDISKNKNSRIVLILESPHKMELKTPIGPAKGKTGENISEYLEKVIKRYSTNPLRPKTKYDLILLNAIQFQCSMGLPTDFFRTVSFVGLWYHSGMSSFVNRISGLNLNKSDIVFNACTLGTTSHFNSIFNRRLTQKALQDVFDNENIEFDSKTGLRGFIDDTIDPFQKDKEFTFLKVNHPSNWHEKIIIR